MVKKTDPMSAWKKRMQPTDRAEAMFKPLLARLKSLAGTNLIGQSQTFPPKYVLDVSPNVRLHRGARFATVAALGETVYFELLPHDDAFQKTMRKGLKGVAYSPSEGFEFKSMSEDQREKLFSYLDSALQAIGADARAEVSLIPVKPKVAVPIPASEVWTGPLSWTGATGKPSDNFSRFIPADAVFTRCELLIERSTSTGVGMWRTTTESRPGLMQCDRSPGKGSKSVRVIAVHTVGDDGSAWSFRLVQKGKQEFMPLFVGKNYDKQTLAPAAVLERARISRIECQSILGWEGGRAITFALRENGEIEERDEADEDGISNDDL